MPSSSTSEEGRDGNLGTKAGRADAGKALMHTIDPKMLMAWGDVLAFGAKKYHQRNFLVAPGMAWSRVYDSLQRHLMAFWGGEWLDGESGLPHLAHVMCNLQFLWTYHEHEQYRASDDRPSSVEYVGRTYKEFEDLLNAVQHAVTRREEERPAPQVPDIFAALAKSSGHKRGPRAGRGTADFSEESTMRRIDSIRESLIGPATGGSVRLDERDFHNLVNMAKGE